MYIPPHEIKISIMLSPHFPLVPSLHHVKRPGAILHPGMLVARINLDDPSHVRQAEKFLGPLPSPPKLSESQKVKVHQVKTAAIHT